MCTLSTVAPSSRWLRLRLCVLLVGTSHFLSLHLFLYIAYCHRLRLHSMPMYCQPSLVAFLLLLLSTSFDRVRHVVSSMQAEDPQIVLDCVARSLEIHNNLSIWVTEQSNKDGLAFLSTFSASDDDVTASIGSHCELPGFRTNSEQDTNDTLHLLLSLVGLAKEMCNNQTYGPEEVRAGRRQEIEEVKNWDTCKACLAQSYDVLIGRHSWEKKHWVLALTALCIISVTILAIGIKRPVPTTVSGQISHHHQGAVADKHHEMFIGSSMSCNLQETVKPHGSVTGVSSQRGGGGRDPESPGAGRERVVLLRRAPNASVRGTSRASGTRRTRNETSNNFDLFRNQSTP